MTTITHKVLTANEAVAQIAYKTNEVFAIYPITPSSEMSELVEEWNAKKHPNIFGSETSVFQMQSEAGVAGTMHGALQTGSLSTTFTASQGLLLMLPNMYKIAGELTPNVIHVASRSIATHALSVFGDHSDIMAVRSSGYAIFGGSSVQEAHDFALISQIATLKSRIPFVHFFDGFRTSHESSKIQVISDEHISELIDSKVIDEHRNRALSPDNPVLRGSSQGPETFFESREATNTFYNLCPRIVQSVMDKFAGLTNRQYRLFEYVGHPEANNVIITMGSSCQTVERTIEKLNSTGEAYGLIKVRLFRPFSATHLLEALPVTCTSIAVLDRTKEAGSCGEPLFLDVVQSLSKAFQNGKIESLPKVIGGRYGLSSKEFTPDMVYAIFNNLQNERPKQNFTVGINDDLSHLSLPKTKFQLETSAFEALFYQHKGVKSPMPLDGLLHLIEKNKDEYVQSYTEIDLKKYNSRYIKNLRIDSRPIEAPYVISKADFVFCESIDFIKEDNVLKRIKPRGTLLINSEMSSKNLWDCLSPRQQEEIQNKNLSLWTVDIKNLKPTYYTQGHKVSALCACLIYTNKGLCFSDNSLNELSGKIVKVSTEVQLKINPYDIENDMGFSTTLLGKLLNYKTDDILVSDVPVDGTFETNTSIFNKPLKTEFTPNWNPESCVQCGACSLACPLAAIRMKVLEKSDLEAAPEGFNSMASTDYKDKEFTIQVNNEQCNGCNKCVDACNVEALKLHPASDNEKWDYFSRIPELDRTLIDNTILSQQQLQEPLFKYASCGFGCDEAPYLKLLSQLFGDRLLIANATGTSSIFGGALPTTPWSKNKIGKGPAWSNSLFEDNAEFGLGFRLSLDQQRRKAEQLLLKLSNVIGNELVQSITRSPQNTENEITQQGRRVDELCEILKSLNSNDATTLLKISNSFVKKSVWCIGGDGWAYDIGYGGLDHVIASGKNVNILVLDNQLYSNTGGQVSKATPRGVLGKFAYSGKTNPKKDLGKLAMTYEHVYVASVSIGADQNQTLKAIIEAENYDGPSIILAYCHNKSHDNEVSSTREYHNWIVASGQWPLYRRHPKRHKNGSPDFQIDSNLLTLTASDHLKDRKAFQST